MLTLQLVALLLEGAQHPSKTHYGKWAGQTSIFDPPHLPIPSWGAYYRKVCSRPAYSSWQRQQS